MKYFRKLTALFLAFCLLAALGALCACSEQAEETYSAPSTVELPTSVEDMVQLQNNTGKTVKAFSYRLSDDEEFTAVDLEDDAWKDGTWIRFGCLSENKDSLFTLRLKFKDGTALDVEDLPLFSGKVWTIDSSGNAKAYLSKEQLSAAE